MRKKIVQFFQLIVILSFLGSCSSTIESTSPTGSVDSAEVKDTLVEGVDYFLPHIDLNNWKVTLPVGDPTNVKPPEILDYANSDLLKDFMYNDSLDGSLVFYTYPGESTPNSSYSRTELREQMESGSDKVNWTFVQGGKIKGRLKMAEISKNVSGDYDRSIVMQIHGRLTDEQRDLIGEDDNNAPPVLKIYWNDKRIRVIRKVLKDIDVNDIDILSTDAWTGDGHWFNEEVGFEEFQLEVIASDGRLEVILNENESMVFDDIHMQKWNVFENYFKAGTYLQSVEPGAFSRVKYYDLTMEH